MVLAYILFFFAFAMLVAGITLAVVVRDEPELAIAVLFAGAIGVFIFGGLGYGTAHTNYSPRTVTCTVTDKDRGGDDGSYRVYTQQCGVLANYDSMIWHGKTNSADVWNQIKAGNTYDFQVVGWRFEPLSDFPNILKVGA